MSLRGALVVLIAVATAAFVVGTNIERHNAHAEHSAEVSTAKSSAPQKQTNGEASGGETSTETTGAAHGGEARPTTTGVAAGGESAAHRAAEGAAELKPLGINIEAVPFVVLAVLMSLALAAAAWFKPRSLPVLIVVVVVMLGFAVLDVREVIHQHDEGHTGLALLAAAVAGLHAAAALVATLMARDARHASGAADAGASIPA